MTESKEPLRNLNSMSEIVADHENRIAVLEAAQLYGDAIPNIRERLDKLEANHDEKPWSKKQWDTVNQLRAQMLHLEKKVITLLEKQRRPTKKLEELI